MTEQTLAWTPRPRPAASVAVPARLTWKDTDGAVRFTSVKARDFSERGAVVECEASVSLPLFRLVHLQIEKSARGLETLPAAVRDGRVLSAVWQVAPCRPSTGTPSGYALRFMTASSGTASSALTPARRAS